MLYSHNTFVSFELHVLFVLAAFSRSSAEAGYRPLFPVLRWVPFIDVVVPCTYHCMLHLYMP